MKIMITLLLALTMTLSSALMVYGQQGESILSEGSENANEDETYSWQVGSSTIVTHIDIMEYIDGDIWRANEMAAALGWETYVMNPDGSFSPNREEKIPWHYEYEGIYISQSYDGYFCCNGLSAYTNEKGLICNLSPATESQEYVYKMNDGRIKWSLEEIACFAYMCEKFSADPNSEPFEGVFSGRNGYYTFVV